MRILFISYYPPFWGGIGTYIYNMAWGIKKFCEKVDVVTTTSFKNSEYLDKKDNIKVTRLKISNWIDGYKKISDFIRQNYNKYDIIEGCESDVGLLFNLFFKHKFNLVIRLHLATFFHIIFEEKKLRTILKFGLIDPLEKILTKNADLITAPSHFISKIEGDRWGIPLEKIEIIPNPIRLPLPISKKNILFEKNSEFEYILFYGRIERIKGIFTILNALPLINKKMKIVFIGEDKLNLKKYIKSKFKDRIIMIDYLKNRDDLMKIVKDAKVVLLPSLFESFLYTILESMSVGANVITTWNGGQREIIEHGKNGFLIEPNNHKELAEYTNYLIDNDSVRKKISKNAIKRANDFEAMKIGKIYVNLLNKKFF
jgi:glycosyltransferase involved in cell wall biosynthesis